MNIFRISIQKNDISSNKVQKKLEHGIEKVKVAQRRKYTNKNTIKSIPSVSFPRHTFSTSFFVTPQFYSGGILLFIVRGQNFINQNLLLI